MMDRRSPEFGVTLLIKSDDDERPLAVFLLD